MIWKVEVWKEIKEGEDYQLQETLNMTKEDLQNRGIFDIVEIGDILSGTAYGRFKYKIVRES